MAATQLRRAFAFPLSMNELAAPDTLLPVFMNELAAPDIITDWATDLLMAAWTLVRSRSVFWPCSCARSRAEASVWAASCSALSTSNGNASTRAAAALMPPMCQDVAAAVALTAPAPASELARKFVKWENWASPSSWAAGMLVEVVRLLRPARVNTRGPLLRNPEVEEKRKAVKMRSHHQREAMSVERTEGGSGMVMRQRRDGALPSLWVTVNLCDGTGRGQRRRARGGWVAGSAPLG